MAESKKPADLVAASFEALDRYEAAQEALAEDENRPPTPGDVYVLEATKDFGIEWAVLALDPADPSRLLVVPADGHVLAGSADVELEDDSPVGALKLRCRFGTWTDTLYLRPDLRVGVLGAEGLVQARQRWLDIGDGEVTGDVLACEVDDDPGYQDWVDGVLVPARQALIEVQRTGETTDGSEESEKEPAPARRSSGPMLLWIAASIALVVGSAQLWHLKERVEDLKTASREARKSHRIAVQGLETQKIQLAEERDRVKDELEVAGVENEQKARELRDLGQRLVVDVLRALNVVNPALVFFNPPERSVHKKEVTLRPDQSHVVVFISLRESVPAPSYQLDVRVKGTETVIWSNDQLVIQGKSEIRIGLPVKVLKQGEFDLELLALESAAPRRVARYELTLRASPDISKR